MKQTYVKVKKQHYHQEYPIEWVEFFVDGIFVTDPDSEYGGPEGFFSNEEYEYIEKDINVSNLTYKEHAQIKQWESEARSYANKELEKLANEWRKKHSTKVIQLGSKEDIAYKEIYSAENYKKFLEEYYTINNIKLPEKQ